MALFRSIDMHLMQFVMSKDSAYDIMEIFGGGGLVDFIDLNKNEQSYELPFTKQIRRGNEVTKKIKSLQQIGMSHGIEQNSFRTMADFKAARNEFEQKYKSSKYDVYDVIESKINSKEEFVCEEVKNMKMMYNERNQLIKYVELFNYGSQFVQENEESFIQISRHSNKFDRDNISNNFGRSNPNLVKDDLYNNTEDDTSFEIQENVSCINVTSIAGVIKQDEVESLRKIVFRLSRGNVLVNIFPINKTFFEYMKEKKEGNKCAYIITFEDGESLRNKLIKVSKTFSEIEFDLDESRNEGKIDEIKSKIIDISKLIYTTSNEMKIYLSKIGEFERQKLIGMNISQLSFYKMIAEYDKSIYTQLNKLGSVRTLIHGYGWSTMGSKEILAKLEENNNTLELHLEDIHNHNVLPPTHFRTNKFIEPFQKIVDTYGVPAYKEINPTVFNIVTFPFLFGIMFGDIGHGAILFLFASYLGFFASRLKHTSLKPMVEIRYLLLLGGFFSTFGGFIYNDFMALPVELFNSGYVIDKKDNVTLKEDGVYPFGLDSTWALANNELTFVNSLKMKFSIIVGVAQMSLGIILKAFNSGFFKRKLDFFFEFIPQLILFWVLFGYMVLLIIVKWLKHYSDTSLAPSIVGYMIDMFLKYGAISRDPLIISLSFNQTLQLFLLLLSLIGVPGMLLGKPLCQCRRSKHKIHLEKNEKDIDKTKKKKGSPQNFKKLDEEEIKTGQQHEEVKMGNRQNLAKFMNQNLHEDDEVDINQIDKIEIDDPEINQKEDKIEEQYISASDLISVKFYNAVEHLMEKHNHSNSERLVHQLIETIEFVLGTVSNTASYLRLWALSLAHSRLAHVFYDKTLSSFLKNRNTVGLFLGFPLFVTATFGVLMGMDSMECFLHTIRLHWVEFQNKFYKGNGYRFNRFGIVKELSLAS